jgi:hypothetical protein
MSETNLIITITVAIGYLAIILMFININRSVKHHIPRPLVIIFFVCLVIAAAAIYLLTPSLPAPFKWTRGRMGSIYMGIWGILFYILHRWLRRIYRKRASQDEDRQEQADASH